MLTRDQKRSRRKRPIRSKTLNTSRVSKSALDFGKNPYSSEKSLPVLKPKVRKDCANVPRPCPFVSCKYNLYLDVTKSGNLKLNFPDLEVWEMKESCSLDLADRIEDKKDFNVEEIGEIMNITREAVRLILKKALKDKDKLL